MNNKKTFLTVAVALLVMIIVAGGLYKSLGPKAEVTLGTTQSTQPPTEVGTAEAEADKELTPAPDFNMTNSDGDSVTLSDHLGKPVVLNFWASWCGPCKSEMPEFDALAAEYGDQVDFMMVNLTDGGRETVEKASEFIEQQGYSFPVYFDTDSEGAEAYYVRSIPTTFFIDAEGNIQAYYTGSMSEDTLRQGIELIR